MELRQLETFEHVARLRSFTKAAEALSLTQPAVTRQIAVLESELHTRLLERMGRQIDLTASGQVLMTYVKEILRLSQEAVRAVEDVTSGGAGRLKVGASNTTSTYILPPLLRQFHQAHPGVELSVHTGASARIAEMVLLNEVDIGFVTGLRENSDLVEIPLVPYATGVVLYPEHPLANRPAGQGVRADELAGSRLILMEEGTNLRSYVDRILSAAGVVEQVAMELDNVEAIKKMIEARLGISLLPLPSVELEVEAGRLAAFELIDVPNSQRTISAIYRKDKYLGKAISAFITLLHDNAMTL